MTGVTPKHSTATDAVQKIYDRLINHPNVKRMSFGVISPCKTVRGNRRVKILREEGALLFKVRDISSVQELRLYVSDGDEILNELKMELIKLGFEVA